MKLKFFFQLFLCVLSFSAIAQVGIAPLRQYSVGYNNNKNDGFQLRTTSTTVTTPKVDTLKLPFIEDFSGPCIPLQKITVELLGNGPTQVYQLTYIKRHALNTGDSIKVFNTGTTNIANSNLINGVRFVQVIDDYTFQLFDDKALSTPTHINPLDKMTSCNWARIGLPFYSHVPDSLSFANDSGGVYINNDMSLNPINMGVASFDGANYQGIPYSNVLTAKGYADKLTSLPFNLSSNIPKDSIYFSFYWESKSLGDSPIAIEFLSLEFKDASQTWNQVWQQFGPAETDSTIDTLIRVMIPITNTAYLHKSFQYRFRSYGVLYGRFNVWNVDYIYMDANRSYNDSLKDIMIVQTNQSCLKNYTSVPYKHIKDLSAQAILSQTDSAFILIRDNAFNPNSAASYDSYHLIRDNLSKDTITNDKFSLTVPQVVYKLTFGNIIPVTRMTAPYALKEEFYIKPLSADSLNRFDLSFNNFAAIETIFYDYYAYDDNIPETTVYTSNPGGIKLGQAMTILKTDTLTHIDFCFLRNDGPDMTNTQIYMNVWKQNDLISQGAKLNPNNSRIDAVKLNQLISIQYSTGMNGFVRYSLNTPIILNAGETYLFGYTQNVISPLFTGYDKNNDHSAQTYVCIDNINWEAFSFYNPNGKGALMIRPVFSKNEVITSTRAAQSSEVTFTIFPNPAQAELHFTGEPEYMYVYDISGLLVLEKNVRDQQSISTEALNNGLYIVVLSKGDYKEAKRLIIQK
jgi:hypothetical protein